MLGRSKKAESQKPADDSEWYLVLRNDLGREMRREGPVVGAKAVVEWLRLWETTPRVEAVAERLRPEPAVVEMPKEVW